MSPNTGAWEQWQYFDLGAAGNRLVSFHGTTIAVSSTYSLHGPRFDGSSVLQGHSAPRDEPVVFDYDTGTVRLMTGAGTDLGETGETAGRFGRNFPWTAIEITSPAGGRAPEQRAVGSNFTLKSVHNTFLTLGSVVDYWTSHAVQGASKRLGPVFDDPAKGYTQMPLRYGNTVWIRAEGGLALLQATSENPPLVTFVSSSHENFNAGNAWVFVDVSGKHAAGDHIVSGETVAIRNVATGRYLSCPPPNVSHRPYLTPNAIPAAWEFWTIQLP